MEKAKQAILNLNGRVSEDSFSIFTDVEGLCWDEACHKASWNPGGPWHVKNVEATDVERVVKAFHKEGCILEEVPIPANDRFIEPEKTTEIIQKFFPEFEFFDIANFKTTKCASGFQYVEDIGRREHYPYWGWINVCNARDDGKTWELAYLPSDLRCELCESDCPKNRTGM